MKRSDVEWNREHSKFECYGLPTNNHGGGIVSALGEALGVLLILLPRIYWSLPKP